MLRTNLHEPTRRWPYIHADPEAYKTRIEKYTTFKAERKKEPIGYIHPAKVQQFAWPHYLPADKSNSNLILPKHEGHWHQIERKPIPNRPEPENQRVWLRSSPQVNDNRNTYCALTDDQGTRIDYLIRDGLVYAGNSARY